MSSVRSVGGAQNDFLTDSVPDRINQALWHQQSDAVGQELKQVWFTGVHSDVGGGYSDTSLSDIALLWMAERAREFGLEFQPGALSAEGPPR